MSLITRSAVISGAENDDFHVDGLAHCGHAQPVLADIILDAAAVRGLDTAVDLLDQPPQGKKIEPLGVYYSKAAGAYGAGAAITINFKDTFSTGVSTIPLSAMTNASAVTGWATRRTQSGPPDRQSSPIEGVDLITGTAFTGNGGDLEVTMVYLEVDA